MAAMLYSGAKKITKFKPYWERDIKSHNDLKRDVSLKVKMFEKEINESSHLKKLINVTCRETDIGDLEIQVPSRTSKSANTAILLNYDMSTPLCDSKTDESSPLFKLMKTKLNINNAHLKDQEGSRNLKTYGGTTENTLPIVANAHMYPLGDFKFFDKIPHAKVGLFINKPHSYESIEYNAYQQSRYERHLAEGKKNLNKVYEELPCDTLKSRYEYLEDSFKKFRLQYLTYNLEHPNNQITKLCIIANPILDGDSKSAKADYDHLYYLSLDFLMYLITLKNNETETSEIVLPKIQINKLNAESLKNRNIYVPSRSSLKRVREMVCTYLIYSLFLYIYIYLLKYIGK